MKFSETQNVNEAIKIKFKGKLDGGAFFQVIERDTSGMKGTQDQFQMVIVKDKKIVKDLGTNPSLKGAITFFQNNKKKIEGMTESDLNEGKDDLTKISKPKNEEEINEMILNDISGLNENDEDLAEIGKLDKERTVTKKKIANITKKLDKLEKGLERFDLSKMTAMSPERAKMRKALEKITKLEDELHKALEERIKIDKQIKQFWTS